MSKASTVSRSMIAALAAIGISSTAQAGSLSVSPVSVTLDEKMQTAAVTLRNEGDESRVVQTELLRWTQQNDEDVQTPSHDLLVNPPIVTLRPGQTQIIRVGLNRKVDKAQELAYRLYVTEVPPPPKEGFTGLRIALRLGLGVYVTPKAKLVDRLDWSASRNQEGNLILSLRNSGNHHVRMTNVKVRDAVTGKQLAEWQQPHITLLAGQSRQISLSLPADWRGSQASLVATTDDGVAETRIGLEQPAR